MRLGAKTVLEVFEHTASAAAPCASSRRLQRPSAALRACDDSPAVPRTRRSFTESADEVAALSLNDLDYPGPLVRKFAIVASCL
jgi:hypothetical protein